MNKCIENIDKAYTCKCKCRFDGGKCNSGQWWNNDKCRCEFKKSYVCEKDYVWYSATCNCENGKYLASIVYRFGRKAKDDDKTKTILTSFNEKKATCKTQSFCILLAFSLITTAL